MLSACAGKLVCVTGPDGGHQLSEGPDLKILFYNHTGQVSGAERMLLIILKGLNRQDFDPVVLCPPDGRLSGMATEAGARIIHIDSLTARFTWRIDYLFRYLGSFVGVIRATRSTVRNEAPDLIHANSIRAGLVMSAATVWLGIPIVWHAHDLLPRHPLSTAIRLFALASRRNRIIAVSQAVSDRFRGVLGRWFSRRVPVTKIYNAVDPERFQPNFENRHELRRALGIKEGQLLVGTVGQLTPRKGQLEVIEVFTKVAREIPEAVLLIVGQPIFNRDAEYAACLVRAAHASNMSAQIRLLGAREDVPALMRAFDLLVVNSRSEPFGLTIVEAMLSGTPVLAAAVDGIPEIVRHRENGWLVSARDQQSLTQAMLMLLEDENLRAHLSRNGRREAIDRFSVERYIRDIQSFYRQTFCRSAAGSSARASSFGIKFSDDCKNI